MNDLAQSAMEYATAEATRLCGKRRDPLHAAFIGGFVASLIVTTAFAIADVENSVRAISITSLLCGVVTWIIFRSEEKRWNQTYERTYRSMIAKHNPAFDPASRG